MTAMRVLSTPETLERSIRRSSLAIVALSLPIALSACGSTQAFDAPFAEYQQRSIMVATAGGDSLAANTALQTATPWPRYANNTNIPADGARMANVVKRYEGAAGDNGSQPPSYGGASGPSGLSGMNGASTGPGLANAPSALPPPPQ
jgi:hypothetical protein